MKYITGAASDVGSVKKVNQDSLIIKSAKNGNEDIVLAAVCDGVGGLKEGEVASGMMVEGLKNWFDTELPNVFKSEPEKFEKTLCQSLKMLVLRVGREIAAYADNKGISCGTTLAGILIIGKTFYTVNVGDSRVYLFRDGETHHLTTDQTVAQREISKGNITAEEAKTLPKGNVLLQCVGRKRLLEDGTKGEIEPVFTTKRVHGDDIILVCSDGFRHTISETGFATTLKPKFLTSKEDLTDILNRLIDVNKERRERDNISAILIKAEEEQLAPGDLIDGRYKILDIAGTGGMSVVYRVVNVNANKIWALKEVRKKGVNNQQVYEQTLIREIDILKKLHHKNLPEIIDVLERDDSILLLMDYIEGVSLSQSLKDTGAQKQEDVIKWGIQLCDVLSYLHNQEPAIIYHDIKPSNVMLKPDGDIALIDFGTAKETKEQNEQTPSLGTRGYAAPEQYGIHTTDARTDIYNLGATLYHLVTNHNPFLSEMKPIRQWNPALSAGLEAVILKATQEKPEDRYQTCAEMMYDLEHYYEMDESYINERKKKFRKYVATLTAAVACFVAAAGVSHYENNLAKNNYDALIRQAATATTSEDKVENFRAAIELDPTSLTGYENLLNDYLSDNVFSRSEAEAMVQTIRTHATTTKTNEDMLRTSEDYDKFAYQMGIAYYYYYEGDGNKPMSEPWFAIAKDSKVLEPRQVTRATVLHSIANYYQDLASANKAGDIVASYMDYFNDLTTLNGENLVEADNARTALISLREFSFQLSAHAYEFHKAGVSEKEMREAAASIKKHLSQDIVYEDLEDADKEIYDIILENLEKAEGAITATGNKEVEKNE